MSVQFDPNNNIVQLCLQGMGMEDSGKHEDASLLFLKAWSEATEWVGQTPEQVRLWREKLANNKGEIID